MTVRVVSAAIIKIVDGKAFMLLQQRLSRAVFGNSWECPGGKVDDDDRCADSFRAYYNAHPGLEASCAANTQVEIADKIALTRELREELGINAEVGRCLGSLDFSVPDAEADCTITFYLVDSWVGEPQPHVAQALYWHSLDFKIDPKCSPVLMSVSKALYNLKNTMREVEMRAASGNPPKGQQPRQAAQPTAESFKNLFVPGTTKTIEPEKSAEAIADDNEYSAARGAIYVAQWTPIESDTKRWGTILSDSAGVYIELAIAENHGEIQAREREPIALCVTKAAASNGRRRALINWLRAVEDWWQHSSDGLDLKLNFIAEHKKRAEAEESEAQRTIAKIDKYVERLDKITAALEKKP